MVNTADRSELEVMILQNDLEDSLFGGIHAIMKMNTEGIREKLIQWIEDGDETSIGKNGLFQFQEKITTDFHCKKNSVLVPVGIGKCK